MGAASKQVVQKQNMNQVISEMTQRLEFLQECGDYRVIFQRVYLLMTKEMQRRLIDDFFEDSVWMERVLVKFAQYYFDAIDSYEIGKYCSPAWKLAFDQATDRRGFVVQDALLGINAHINSDLPMVLHSILTEDKAWPDARIMMRRRQDHERINEVLADLVDLAQDELANHHARFIRPVDFLMGRKDESLSSFILTHCRSSVWYNTELLLDAPDEEQWNFHKKRIENDAYTIALRVTQYNSRRFTLLKRFASFARRYRWF
ncbi:hypothetical protein GH741_03305 [Aquibacillus halophilus]|uniref:Uncharacterized protein n=1 Tax=Aquibacillus halophilus TaxID=930132 RepID=A0A6A8D7W8_9BACI|nr:DUF5995 family protein [Aquibacillus halophilus]MRH41698.1 hypothetical protein [Aquibacillus halophilus]